MRDIDLPENGFWISSKGEMYIGLPRTCDKDGFNVDVYYHDEDARNDTNKINTIYMLRDSFRISVNCVGCS